MGSRRGLQPLSGSTASPGLRRLLPGGTPGRPGRPSSGDEIQAKARGQELGQSSSCLPFCPCS